MLAKALELHDVTFWLGDAIDLPESLGRFDVVFLNAMFGNVWDQRATLSEVDKVPQSRGRKRVTLQVGS